MDKLIFALIVSILFLVLVNLIFIAYQDNKKSCGVIYEPCVFGCTEDIQQARLNVWNNQTHGGSC